MGGIVHGKEGRRRPGVQGKTPSDMLDLWRYAAGVRWQGEEKRKAVRHVLVRRRSAAHAHVRKRPGIRARVHPAFGESTLKADETQGKGRFEFHCFVAGIPHPKGRPRVTLARGRIHAYTPRATAEWEAVVRGEVWRAMRKRPPFVGPVAAQLLFWFPRPSRSRAQFPSADLDNLVKAVLDAMVGVVIRDDRQVVYMQAHKDFVATTQTPGVEIYLREPA
jgi:Holliday junction resolvase RusA-like endonuclease